MLRLDLSLQTRAVASALAWLGNADGSHMVPADPILLNVVNLSYRQAVGTHIALLLKLKLLQKTKRAGGRTKRPYDEFHLCLPADLAILPYRLDADFLRIEDRPKGAVPIKAIEASRTARLERNATSGETTPPPSARQQRASGESADSLPFDEKSASGETGDASQLGRKQPSAETPVDNSLGRNAASVRTTDPVGASEKTPSAETEFERKASALSTEGQRTLDGSPASVPVFKTLKTPNPTTRVVSLGGDLTSGADDDEQPEAAADIDQPLPSAAAGAEPATPRPIPVGSPEDPEYDGARLVLGGVDPADLGDLLANAQAEIELELNDGVPLDGHGVTARADHRQIMIRAAQIVARTEAGGR